MRKLLVILFLMIGLASKAQLPVMTRAVLVTDSIVTPPAGVKRSVLTNNSQVAGAGQKKSILIQDILPIVFTYFFNFNLN